MLDVPRRYWLSYAHRQRCFAVALCLLPAGSGVFALVQGMLPFLAVAVVVEPVGPGILCCWGWVPDFVQGLCLCGVVIEIVMVYYGSLPLNYCE